ncbi:site-specific integrase [Streptomyces sp. NPDC097727]|uniref:site-specific integrase n=1 Tax=Streptomyces sp. NPDC097727 TaxID=3366092 RepID=UPI00382341B1
MGGTRLAPGAAGLHLVGGLPLLRPDEQVFTAMLDGWRNQQLARNLAFSTIEVREKTVRAFVHHADAFPWAWSPQMLDEWMGDLRAVRGLKRSTLRNYQGSVRSFCSFITDPAYGWATTCQEQFGTHPVQVVHEWNSAVHVEKAEADAGKRAFTHDELQAFFDYADDQVDKVRGRGRKGWLPAFRDAVLFKTAYAFGLRRNETRMLDTVDFGRNPEGPEFGDYGVLYVRHGKAVEVVIYRRPSHSSPGGLMLVQRVLMPDSPLESWTVLGDEGGIVEPIERYLAYLADIERSPNTVKAYAHDLKDWFVFLDRRGLDWREVRLEDLGEFVAWLRLPPAGRDSSVTLLPRRIITAG